MIDCNQLTRGQVTAREQDLVTKLQDWFVNEDDLLNDLIDAVRTADQASDHVQSLESLHDDNLIIKLGASNALPPRAESLGTAVDLVQAYIDASGPVLAFDATRDRLHANQADRQKVEARRRAVVNWRVPARDYLDDARALLACVGGVAVPPAGPGPTPQLPILSPPDISKTWTSDELEKWLKQAKRDVKTNREDSGPLPSEKQLRDIIKALKTIVTDQLQPKPGAVGDPTQVAQAVAQTVTIDRQISGLLDELTDWLGSQNLLSFDLP